MTLRIEEIGELDDGRPGVVLRGNEDDVRRAARHFGEAVAIVPISALARLSLDEMFAERVATTHPITTEAKHG